MATMVLHVLLWGHLKFIFHNNRLWTLLENIRGACTAITTMVLDNVCKSMWTIFICVVNRTTNLNNFSTSVQAEKFAGHGSIIFLSASVCHCVNLLMSMSLKCVRISLFVKFEFSSKLIMITTRLISRSWFKEMYFQQFCHYTRCMHKFCRFLW